MTIKSISLLTAALLSTDLYADETLEPISIISANKTNQSIQRTTSNVTVITSQEIEENGYQTVTQAINTVAGISVTNSGGLGQQTSFFVRGADSGKVLVLLDGMRLNDPSTTNGTALLDSLTTSNIEQIEIIKGGASSIWGSNASAGVINIITKEAKEGFHGAMGLSYGSYATKGAEVELSYKDDKLTAQILSSYLDSHGFSALAPRNAESDGYTNKNVNLKLGYAFDENSQLRLSYNRINTDTQYDDSWSPDLANDAYSHADSDQKNYALDYDFKRDAYSAALHASESKYDRDYYSSSGHNVYRSTLNEYAFINAYEYTNGKAVLGFEYKDIDGFNQYNTFPESQSGYINKAVYLSNIYDITENTLLETNLRYDHYNKFENRSTYKVGVKHASVLLQGVTASANYSTSYDAPSSYQLANQSPAVTLLSPAYTKGYDISVSYQELFSISYFNNRVEEGIDYVGVWPDAGYANIQGTQKFSGMELESSYALPAFNINLSANYTHLFSYEKEDGTDLIRRAKDTLNAEVVYYMDSDTQLGINAQYVGDRLDTDGNWPASSVSTGNYTVWNMNYSTQILENTDLMLHADNIFDKTYQSSYGYATAGRSFNAKIKYRF
jgi:vitamin B12 transporter